MTLPADFSEIDADRRAAAVFDDINAAKRTYQREHRRPRALTAREALLVLQFEGLVVTVAATNIANGINLCEADLERLLLASARITFIVDEAVG